MEIKQCPICGIDSFNEDITDVKLVRCHICSNIWTYIPYSIDNTFLYEEGVYEVVDNRGTIFEKIIFYESSKIIKSINRIISAPKQIRVLDFGCGKGHFLFMAKIFGWNTFGIETSLPRANFAKEKYNLKINTDFYEKGRIGAGNFDVITLLHVLEHLPDPINLLKELTDNNLNKDGILVLEVPNIKSFQSTLAGNHWMHLDLPKHITHWDAEGLKQELTKINIKIIKRQNFSMHLGVLGMLDTLLQKFGYKKNIILQLKKYRDFKLVMGIIILLPIAFLIESLACMFNRGGIMRFYCKRISQ